MAQLKQTCSVTNNGQQVIISGIDLTARIRRYHIFMVEGDLTPYTVAQDSTFVGGNTLVWLSGVFKGETNAAASCVFATDFTYPDMIPTIAHGDVGTASIFTAAMHRLQSMIATVAPGGLAMYQQFYDDVIAKVSEAESLVIDARNSANASESSAVIADASADSATASSTLAQNWANKPTGEVVAGQGYSALYHATASGTSATLAQNWANKTTGEVVAGQGYSARYHATASGVSAALSKDWANKLGAEVAAGQGYSALYHAQAAAASAIAAAESAASAGSGSVASANKWTTPRTLSMTGDATGSMSVDGTADKQAALTLATVNSNVGTFNNVTVNGKGLVTAASNVSYQASSANLTNIAAIADAGRGVLRKTGTATWALDTVSYQPVDANLTSIIGLAGTTGLLRKTAAGTFALDTVSYQPSLGYTPVQQGTGANQSNNAVKIGWGPAGKLLLTVDATDFGATWPIDVVGGAGSAARLTNPRSINGVNFDGTGNITIGAAWANITGRPTTIATAGYTDFKREVLAPNADFNWLNVAGMYRYNGTTVGNGPGSWNYGNVLVVRGEGSDTCGQLYMDYVSGLIATRGVIIGSGTSTPWRFSVGNDGTGAAGTWGINITGSATNTHSCTNAVNVSHWWQVQQQFTTRRIGAGVTTGGGHNGSSLQVYSNDGGPAHLTFLREGTYGVNFGLDADNYLRIGGWSAGHMFSFGCANGDFYAAGNITAYSDERLKKNWRALGDDFVELMAGVKAGIYDRKDTGESQAGVSAQDVRAILPYAVSESNDEMKTLSLAYGNFAGVGVVKLAQRSMEHDARIVALETELAELKSLVKQLLNKDNP